MSEFAAWDSFYVGLGSAAGAVIGLPFVVMTLFPSAVVRMPCHAVLLLLRVGIHNAWDAVSFHVLVRNGSGKKEG